VIAGEIDRAAASFACPSRPLLPGARAGDIPIGMPTHFELAINSRTAKALGLAVPPTLLSLVPHEVIE
jgi:putative ABC transport system substrate-binding protein